VLLHRFDMGISYLLLHMEEYAGLAILATNSRSSLDAAFLGILRFVIGIGRTTWRAGREGDAILLPGPRPSTPRSPSFQTTPPGGSEAILPGG
jgi:hypothetical protein